MQVADGRWQGSDRGLDDAPFSLGQGLWTVGMSCGHYMLGSAWSHSLTWNLLLLQSDTVSHVGRADFHTRAGAHASVHLPTVPTQAGTQSKLMKCDFKNAKNM